MKDTHKINNWNNNVNTFDQLENLNPNQNSTFNTILKDLVSAIIIILNNI